MYLRWAMKWIYWTSMKAYQDCTIMRCVESIIIDDRKRVFSLRKSQMHPVKRLGDLFDFNNRKNLVTVDYYIFGNWNIWRTVRKELWSRKVSQGMCTVSHTWHTKLWCCNTIWIMLHQMGIWAGVFLWVSTKQQKGNKKTKKQKQKKKGRKWLLSAHAEPLQYSFLETR